MIHVLLFYVAFEIVVLPLESSVLIVVIVLVTLDYSTVHHSCCICKYVLQYLCKYKKVYNNMMCAIVKIDS